MSDLKTFSGPPSNKVTAATLAAAVATLFWTIAAHTFWKSMSIDDLTVYITTSTVLITALISFFVPESEAFTIHSHRRHQEKVRNTQPARAAGAHVNGQQPVR
jgi:hypothetical protein